MDKTDAIGEAIWDYYTDNQPGDVIVSSPIFDDDIMPIKLLFRSYDDFPAIEREAMRHCEGEILDVGAAAGIHTRYLLSQGKTVDTLEKSPKAHQYLKTQFPNRNHYCMRMQDFNEKKYDTIMLLMNGLGICGRYDQLPDFLEHLKTLLKPGGKIICDSTDVHYLYDNFNKKEWMSLTHNHYGDFEFKMSYKEFETDWFDWLYLDLESLKKVAEQVNLSLSLLAKQKDSYLVELKLKEK